MSWSRMMVPVRRRVPSWDGRAHRSVRACGPWGQRTGDFDVGTAGHGDAAGAGPGPVLADAAVAARLRHARPEDRRVRRSGSVDRGHQAWRAGNPAFTDGGCIPRRDFVERPPELAEP